MRYWRDDVVKIRSASRHPVALLLGAVAVLALANVDPALLSLLFDPELIALIGTAGVALLRGDVRAGLLRFATSLPVLWVRVGCALTRSNPRSLLDPVAVG